MAKATLLASGLPASPGCAIGIVVHDYGPFAESVLQAGGSIVLVRPETSPDDLPGMLKASALVTARGGATSHAAVVARGIGRPAVVGCGDGLLAALPQGRTVTVDGASGRVYDGALPLVAPVADPYVAAARALLDETPAGALRKRVHLALDAQTRRLDAMFRHYLLLAVVGELRHLHDCAHGEGRKPIIQKLEAYGVPMGGPRAEAQDAAVAGIRGVDATREVLDLAVSAFCSLSWGSSFGGKKWGVIAKTLHDRLRWSWSGGKEGLPPAVFVDRVFDLEHNGGKVFDKRKARLSFDAWKLKEFLDAKFAATVTRDLEDWLVKVPLMRGVFLEAEVLGLLREKTPAQAPTPKKKVKKLSAPIAQAPTTATATTTTPCTCPVCDGVEVVAVGAARAA